MTDDIYVDLGPAGCARPWHVFGTLRTFVRILPQLGAGAASSGPDQPRGQTTLTTDTAQGASAPATIANSALDDIALAHREICALYDIAQAMGISLGVANTMALISSKLASLVPFSACALFLYAESGETLVCRFATGIDANIIQKLKVRDAHGLTGWVARNRQPLVNARPSADFEAGGSDRHTSLQSALVCPLVFNDRSIGTLTVYHSEPGFYRDDHRRLLARVCEQAAAVIHNSVVFERTRKDSLTDALTGLPNTRYMCMHFARELARARRLESQVALLVIDLDDFKDINDRYGHRIGDRALQDVANVMRSAIRPYDICIRYAGDEFIVLLSGCSRGEADNKRRELQNTVGRVVIEPQPGTRVPLAVSIGFAIYPDDGSTYEALLAQADTQMYRDKERRKRAARAKRDARGADASADDEASSVERAL